MHPLKSRRVGKGMTRRALAIKVGATESTVFNWERGRHRPEVRFLLKLAKVFEVRPETLEREIREAV